MSALSMIGKVESALRELLYATRNPDLPFVLDKAISNAEAALAELEKDRTP